MAGNKEGGLKTAVANKKRDPEFYKRIGAMGGSKPSEGRGFASKKRGPDGLTGAQRARKAGGIGGAISRRGSRIADNVTDDHLNGK